MSLYARLAALAVIAAILAGIGWKIRHDGYEAGMTYVHRLWDAEKIDLRDRAIKEQQAKAAETFRRTEAQERNQHAQNEELATARAAADRNARDADRVREQSAEAARDWAARLADSPTRADLAAASAAISVLTDVRGRLDRAASELAAYADTARAAGNKCAADYDSLTKP